jgi:hypothetical protein
VIVSVGDDATGDAGCVVADGAAVGDGTISTGIVDATSGSSDGPAQLTKRIIASTTTRRPLTAPSFLFIGVPSPA